MSATFKCAFCGHTWTCLEDETAKHIRKSVEVNQQGPFCALCHHLDMAERYAQHRGITLFQAVAGRAAIIQRSQPTDEK